MDFFGRLWEIINEGNVDLKFSKFKKFYAEFKADDGLEFKRNSLPEPLIRPCYADFCEVVAMRALNKKPANKQLAFIHSIAHIEFSAVDIALDACYRFDGLPREYYQDWLEVADDEIRHFLLLCALLEKNGAKYGDFIVHDGLFVALCKTQDNLVNRMALLPRYMEANGLDANAHIISNLKAQNGDSELIGVLELILQEEVAHVAKGDRWFKFACQKQGISADEYIKIIRDLYPNSFATARNLNEKDRLAAGFSKDELEAIKALGR